MDMYEQLDIEQLIKTQQEKCRWRVIVKTFMEYDIPVECPLERWVRAYFKKLMNSEMDKEAGF